LSLPAIVFVLLHFLFASLERNNTKLPEALDFIRVTDQMLIEALIASKSVQHNNYQDFDAFLKAGGKIGLQHDPLLYGAYLLNPFLVRLEEVPMLVVKQACDRWRRTEAVEIEHHS
jgi:hypothetical protein